MILHLVPQTQRSIVWVFLKISISIVDTNYFLRT